MKVFYIGPYRDGTGASKVSEGLIKSMLSANIDLVIRPIKSNNFVPNLSDDILDAEQKSALGANVLIQHFMPDMMVYKGEYKNIGYINYHTDSFKYSGWQYKLNLMDEVWVPSKFVENCCRKSGVTVPIRIIPPAIDESIFLRNYPAYKQIEEQKQGDFLFYNISGSFSRRKNFGAFVKAFHLEFNKNEPVNIALKFIKDSSMPDMNPHTFLSEIKNGLKIDSNKQEIVLPLTHLSDSEIYSIHNSCDVFVSSSYGEGSCIPALEAMGFGRTPIVNSFSGANDYVDTRTGWNVDYSLEPVFELQSQNKLFYGIEKWGAISIPHLQTCMREAYENHKLREAKSEFGINEILNYSYNEIGYLIKKALNEQTQQSGTPSL